MLWMLLFWIQYLPCCLSMPSRYYQFLWGKGDAQHSPHQVREEILVLLPVQGTHGIDPRLALPGRSSLLLRVVRLLSAGGLLRWREICKLSSLIWKHSFKTFLHFSLSSIPADLSQTFKILLDASAYLLHLHEFYIILHVQTQGIKNTVLFLFPSSSVKEIKRLRYIWLSSPFGFFSEVIAVLK